MSVLIVTGTARGVGKTVLAAALATCTEGSVAVVKLAQTGRGPGAPGDLAEVTRLSGCRSVHEFARYPDQLSPWRAAIHAELPVVDLARAEMQIAELDLDHDVVIVEGTGGLLEPFDRDLATIADLAMELDSQILIVTSVGPNSFNHTQLTAQHVTQVLGVGRADIVIGTWPDEPTVTALYNAVDLSEAAPGRRLAGVLPARMSQAKDFRAAARAALAPKFGGTFDSSAFLAEI